MPVSRLTDTKARRISKSTSPPANKPQAVRVASHDCSHLAVLVGPTVITNVQASNSAPLQLAPVLPGARYTLQVAGLITGLTVNHIRWVLHTYANRFDERVVQLSMPSGKPTSRFPRRLLSARDIDTLRKMYPVIVKPNPPR